MLATGLHWQLLLEGCLCLNKAGCNKKYCKQQKSIEHEKLLNFTTLPQDITQINVSSSVISVPHHLYLNY